VRINNRTPRFPGYVAQTSVFDDARVNLAMKVTAMTVAMAFSMGWANSAFATQTNIGPMQSFQDFCLSSNLSIEAVVDLAKLRHYKLVVDRQLPGPGKSTILNKTWSVEDITGTFALTVTQSEGSSPGRSFQCGVTLPKGSEVNVESFLESTSHLGVPDQKKNNADGSRTVKWVRRFEWGTATVTLVDKLAHLQGGGMINVLYRVAQ